MIVSAPRPFSETVRTLGRSTVIGGVLPVDVDGRLAGPGDIEAQTHAVFRNLHAILAERSLKITDMVRLNTYYIGDVPEDAVTAYWERMTRVRLQYLELPGPAAMAVRINGTGLEGALITLEGEAIPQTTDDGRLRIMPAESWDWSVPVPFSQGWREGRRVWIGGQVSADDKGRAVFPGDTAKQTQKIMTFIANVLADANGTMDDLCHLKICYRHDGDTVAAEARLGEIIKVVRENCPTLPPVTAFGANLLYGGLMVEIDGAAVLGDQSETIAGPGVPNRNWANESYAVRRGQHLQFGGFSPPADTVGDDMSSQAKAAAEPLAQALAEVGGFASQIGRINVFHCFPPTDGDPSHLLREASGAISDALGGNRPPVTLVRCVGLPGDAKIQMEGYCLPN